MSNTNMLEPPVNVQQPEQPEFYVSIHAKVSSMAQLRDFLDHMCQVNFTDVAAQERGDSGTGHYGEQSYTFVIQTRTGPDSLSVLPIADNCAPTLGDLTITDQHDPA